MTGPRRLGTGAEGAGPGGRVPPGSVGPTWSDRLAATETATEAE